MNGKRQNVGFFLFYRDYPFLKLPGEEKLVMLWFIKESAWKDHERQFNGSTIIEKRGQKTFTWHILEKAMQKDIPGISADVLRQRIVKSLEKKNRVKIVDSIPGENGRVTIEIVDYNRYQPKKESPDLPPDKTLDLRDCKQSDYEQPSPDLPPDLSPDIPKEHYYPEETYIQKEKNVYNGAFRSDRPAINFSEYLKTKSVDKKVIEAIQYYQEKCLKKNRQTSSTLKNNTVESCSHRY